MATALVAVSAATCGQTDTVIVDLGGHADTLVVASRVDTTVLTNPDTTFGTPDTVIMTRVDTVVTPPDSVLITRIDTVTVQLIDTIVVGVDTTFVPRTDTVFSTIVDTLVAVDTIISTIVDTLVTVDTVVVADTVYLSSRLVASRGSLTLDSGRTATLDVSAQDPLGVTTVPQAITWLSDAPGVASVNDGRVTGRSPGMANIFALASGLSVTVPTTVRRVEAPPPPPPPPPAGSQSRFFRAHEPGGMTRLNERQFNAIQENWTTFEFNGSPESIVSDATAPHSPPNVMQYNFREGSDGGNSQDNRAAIGWSPARNTIYLYVTWKIDPNWQGHDSSINKQFFLQVNNPNRGAGNQTFFLAFGRDYGALRIYVQGQQHCCGATFLNYEPNVGNATLTRGQWHELEFLFVANTPGERDGTLRVWKDGEMTHDYSNFGPLDADEGPGFLKIWWASIWGGTGDRMVADQWIRMDHVYVSGK